MRIKSDAVLRRIDEPDEPEKAALADEAVAGDAADNVPAAVEQLPTELADSTAEKSDEPESLAMSEAMLTEPVPQEDSSDNGNLSAEASAEQPDEPSIVAETEAADAEQSANTEPAPPKMSPEEYKAKAKAIKRDQRLNVGLALSFLLIPIGFFIGSVAAAITDGTIGIFVLSLAVLTAVLFFIMWRIRPSYVENKRRLAKLKAKFEGIPDSGASPENRITYEKYLDKHGEIIKDMLICVAFVLLFTFLPILTIIYSFTEPDDGSNNKGLLLVTGVVLLILALYFISKIANGGVFGIVEEISTRFSDLKEKFLSTADDEDLAKFKRRRCRVAAIVVSAVVFIAGVIVCAKVRVPLAYSVGMRYMTEENYVEAEKRLGKIRDSRYRDAETMYRICKAHTLYDEGELESAYKYVNDVYVYASSDYSYDFVTSVNAFKYQVIREYNAIEKPVIKAPYKGMNASEINNTELGHYDEMKQSSDFYALRLERRYTEYYWYEYDSNGNQRTKYCATVRYDKNYGYGGGYVSDVTTYDNSKKHSTTYTPSVSLGSTYRPSGSSKYKTSSSSRYNTSKFSNAEDFYDYYYDDFFSYEDAEDYYNNHKR